MNLLKTKVRAYEIALAVYLEIIIISLLNIL